MFSSPQSKEASSLKILQNDDSQNEVTIIPTSQPLNALPLEPIILPSNHDIKGEKNNNINEELFVMDVSDDEDNLQIQTSCDSDNNSVPSTTTTTTNTTTTNNTLTLQSQSKLLSSQKLNTPKTTYNKLLQNKINYALSLNFTKKDNKQRFLNSKKYELTPPSSSMNRGNNNEEESTSDGLVDSVLKIYRMECSTFKVVCITDFKFDKYSK